jgi:hypothetical protein
MIQKARTENYADLLLGRKGSKGGNKSRTRTVRTEQAASSFSLLTNPHFEFYLALLLGRQKHD